MTIIPLQTTERSIAQQGLEKAGMTSNVVQVRRLHLLRRIVLLSPATIFCAGAVLVAGCTSQGADLTSVDAGPATRQSAARGKALRQAIDEEYERRRHDRQLKPMGQGGNSIDDVVRPFLHAGMKFDDAAQTLRAAGFVVRPRAKSLVSSNLEVIAEIDRYDSVLFGFGGKTSVVIILAPTTQEDWRTVGAASGGFVLSFL